MPSPSRETQPAAPDLPRFHGGDPNGLPGALLRERVGASIRCAPRAGDVPPALPCLHAPRAQPHLVGSDDPHGQLRLTQHAEATGCAVVWASEAYGSDSPTVLAWLAAQTSTIDVGSAVMQIPSNPCHDCDDRSQP